MNRKEEFLQKLELIKMRETTQQAFDSLPEGVIIISKSEKVLSTNKAFEAFWKNWDIDSLKIITNENEIINLIKFLD